MTIDGSYVFRKCFENTYVTYIELEGGKIIAKRTVMPDLIHYSLERDGDK